MRLLIKRIAWVVAFFFLLLLLGWYRSLVDKTDFIHSFDKVSTILVIEVWKLVNNPIVLTGIMILISLQYVKNYNPDTAQWISELTFGNFSAKFSPKNLSKDLTDNKDITRESHVNDKQLIEKVVSNLSLDICWVIVRLADKALTIKEMTNIIINEFETRYGVLSTREHENSAFSFGIFVAMNSILKDTLYTFELADNKDIRQNEDDDKKIKLKISDYTKEQIFKRIQSFDNNKAAEPSVQS